MCHRHHINVCVCSRSVASRKQKVSRDQVEYALKPSAAETADMEHPSIPLSIERFALSSVRLLCSCHTPCCAGPGRVHAAHSLQLHSC